MGVDNTQKKQRQSKGFEPVIVHYYEMLWDNHTLLIKLPFSTLNGHEKVNKLQMTIEKKKNVSWKIIKLNLL